MSDSANAPTGATPEEGLGGWPGSTARADWEQVSSGAGSAEPAPSEGASASRRRPLSLRSGGGSGGNSDGGSGEAPRRRLTPPPFPKPRGRAGHDAPAVAPDGEVSSPKLARPAPIEKFVAVTRERPEAGLAVAFVGGVLIATLLKRFARR